MSDTSTLRDALLEQLRIDLPDWLWVTGELQVDILDAVANFHDNREKIVDLFTSMKDLSGFKRLTQDDVYRSQMSEILGLSLDVRTPSNVYIGVPDSVSNDFDAFVFYYLDRFAERYGRKRGRGSAASGLVTFNYTPGLTGSGIIVFNRGDLLFKLTVSLDGSGSYSGTIYSFGYGSQYNVPSGSLQIKLVSSDDFAVSNIFSYNTSDLTGGTDYQSNDSFISSLDNSLNIFGGPLSINVISSVISSVSSVDKYKIATPSEQQRFIGSMDIYLKGGVLEEKASVKTVGSDLKVLVPYQPSTIVSITKAGAVVPSSEYTVTYPASDNHYKNSVRQLVWITFAGAVVFAGDIVTINMLVDSTVQDVFTSLTEHYSDYNETARDFLVFQAQPQIFNSVVRLLLFRKLSQSVVDSLVQKAYLDFISGLGIQADLQPDDLRAKLRTIRYNGERVVDAVYSLTVAKDGGTQADAILTLSRGQYWELGSVVAEVL